MTSTFGNILCFSKFELLFCQLLFFVVFEQILDLGFRSILSLII